MRGDLWDALAEALPREPTPVVITATADGPLRALADVLGQQPVVVAGETARLAVARGVARQGGRPVVQLGRHVPPASPTGGILAVTTRASAAVAALHEGWSVVHPSLAEDVRGLLTGGDGSVVVLLGPAAAADEPVPSRARWAPRIWRSGDRASLVASGAVIDVALPVSRMLAGRGVSVGVVEMPVLIGRDMEPLAEPDAIHVGPPDAADVLADGAWPDHMRRVDVIGHTSRGLMEAILASIPAAGPPPEAEPVV